MYLLFLRPFARLPILEAQKSVTTDKLNGNPHDVVVQNGEETANEKLVERVGPAGKETVAHEDLEATTCQAYLQGIYTGRSLAIISSMMALYWLSEEDDDCKQEVKRSIDGKKHLVDGRSKSGVILDEVEQDDVEDHGKTVHDGLADMVHGFKA